MSHLIPVSSSGSYGLMYERTRDPERAKGAWAPLIDLFALSVLSAADCATHGVGVAMALPVALYEMGIAPLFGQCLPHDQVGAMEKLEGHSVLAMGFALEALAAPLTALGQIEYGSALSVVRECSPSWLLARRCVARGEITDEALKADLTTMSFGLEKQKLYREVIEREYRLIDMGNDRDALLQAVAKSVNPDLTPKGELAKAKEWRGVIADEMLKNPDKYYPKVSGADQAADVSQRRSTVVEYAEKIRQGEVRIRSEDLTPLTNVLRLNIDEYHCNILSRWKKGTLPNTKYSTTVGSHYWADQGRVYYDPLTYRVYAMVPKGG